MTVKFINKFTLSGVSKKSSSLLLSGITRVRLAPPVVHPIDVRVADISLLVEGRG